MRKMILVLMVLFTFMSCASTSGLSEADLCDSRDVAQEIYGEYLNNWDIRETYGNEYSHAVSKDSKTIFIVIGRGWTTNAYKPELIKAFTEAFLYEIFPDKYCKYYPEDVIYRCGSASKRMQMIQHNADFKWNGNMYHKFLYESQFKTRLNQHETYILFK